MMKKSTLFFCLLACLPVGQAREPARRAAEISNPVSLQTSIITLKGFPLRLATGHLKKMFTDLKCRQPEEFTIIDEVCVADTSNNAELRVLDQPAQEYYFYFANSELIGLAIQLDSAAYEPIATAFTEKYGKPTTTREGTVQQLATGVELPTEILIWKRGFQVLSLEKHYRQIKKMRIMLVAEPYDRNFFLEER